MKPIIPGYGGGISVLYTDWAKHKIVLHPHKRQKHLKNNNKNNEQTVILLFLNKHFSVLNVYYLPGGASGNA